MPILHRPSRKCMESRMYPEENIMSPIESNNLVLYPEDSFWDSGGKTPPGKCSNMHAPSSEIWDKLDLPTPPSSPGLLTDIDADISDIDDIYKFLGTCDSDVAVSELIHDCMWSGQCTDGCRSTSLSKCSMRTRVDSFGSIGNLAEASGFTFSSSSNATPVSMLGPVSSPLLTDDYMNIFSSNECNNGPSALSDHSYSSNQQNTFRTCFSSDDSEDDSDDDDDDDEDDDGDESDEEVGSSSGADSNYLGIPTPSDSEEEIDVVGICESASPTIAQPRIIRTVKTNLPTKPNANQRRTLQLAVERAARNSPTILGGTKRQQIDNKKISGQSTKRKLNSRSKKMQKNTKRKRPSCNLSDNEDSLSSNSGPKDRSQHNSMERKRREDLRSSFFYLRDQVPELASAQRASKVNILIKAADYIRKMRYQESTYEQARQRELKKQQELKRRLQLLQNN